MTHAPHLFVAGMGRCGTTLVMTMLDSGRFPVTGPRPSYELPERWAMGRPDADWLRAQAGRAVKWIDPGHCPDMRAILQPKARPVIILLERDPREQAKSMLKMMGLPATRATVSRLRRSIEQDQPIQRANLRSVGAVYLWKFESLLARPREFGIHLHNIVQGHFGTNFSADDAAGVIMQRHPDCLPDMRMETTILPMLARELADTDK